MAHHVDSARDLQSDRQLLLDQQDRHATLGDLVEQATDLLDQFGRQALGGLVDDDQVGVAHQGSAHRQHLLLTARQHTGRGVAACREVRKQIVCVVELPAAELAGSRQTEFEILLNRQRREDLPVFGHITDTGTGDLVGPQAGDRLAFEVDAAMRLYQAHDGFAGGRPADPVATQQADDLAFVNMQFDTLQDMALAVVSVQITQLEHHVASLPR